MGNRVTEPIDYALQPIFHQCDSKCYFLACQRKLDLESAEVVDGVIICKTHHIDQTVEHHDKKYYPKHVRCTGFMLDGTRCKNVKLCRWHDYR
jgi:hypothetical protein